MNLKVDYFNDINGNQIDTSADVRLRINTNGAMYGYCDSRIEYENNPPESFNNSMYISLLSAYTNNIRDINVKITGSPYHSTNGLIYFKLCDCGNNIPDGTIFNIHVIQVNSEYGTIEIDADVYFLKIGGVGDVVFNKIELFNAYNCEFTIMKYNGKLLILNQKTNIYFGME